MIRVMVTYQVHADRVAENESLVRNVYAELQELADPGIRYVTFRKPDGVTFVHIALLDGPEAQSRLTGTAAFQAFQADLKSRCAVPPKPEPLELVGSVNIA